MSDELVGCTVDDGVAVVTLNNPPMNLVTLELTRRLGRLMEELAADPQARVLVLAGTGERAFCATMAEPEVGADAAGIVGAIATVAGAVATSGLSLLAQGLISQIAADRSTCRTALEIDDSGDSRQ